MRKLILEKLQAKKAGSLKKLSQKGIEILLDKLEAKITTEDEIDSTIDDLDNSVIPFDDVVELIQKETSRNARTVRTNLEKEFDFVPKKKEDDDDDDHDVSKKSSQQADISNQIAEAVKSALAPFAALTKNLKNSETIIALKAKLKEKGVPEDWANDVHIGDDFDSEATVTQLETKWNSAKQVAINEAVSGGQAVLRGNQGGGSSIEESIKEFGKTVTPKDSGFNIQEV